jgi:hypothetical protein
MKPFLGNNSHICKCTTPNLCPPGAVIMSVLNRNVDEEMEGNL